MAGFSFITSVYAGFPFIQYKLFVKYVVPLDTLFVRVCSERLLDIIKRSSSNSLQVKVQCLTVQMFQNYINILYLYFFPVVLL